MIGHTRSRDLRSKVKKLLELTKDHKFKATMPVDRNFKLSVSNSLVRLKLPFPILCPDVSKLVTCQAPIHSKVT